MIITEPITFFGAYVAKAELSMGWNGESGFCTLELYEDPDENIFYTPPTLNTACMFSIGELTFGGIFRKSEYREDIGGRRYSVVIESPAMVLNGIQVILSTFQGDEYIDDTNYSTRNSMLYGGTSPTNIINVFAQMENFNYGGTFGGADYNGMGYPVKNLLRDIQATIDDGNFGGPIYFGQSQYILDLTDLQEVIDRIPDYRIQGDILDFTSLLGNITDVALYDYTSELSGIPNELGVLENPVIKVRVLSRENAPTPGMISTLIRNYQNKLDINKNLISYSTGKEATDAITQKVLFGGNVSRYWVADRSHMIPVWGMNSVGGNISYSLGESVIDYNDFSKPIQVVMDGGSDENFVVIDTNLLEIRCALSGENAWTSYHILTALKEGRKSLTFGNFAMTPQDFVDLMDGNLSTSDLFDSTLENADIRALLMNGVDGAKEEYSQRLVKSRLNTLKMVANDFYGKQFLVRLPDDPGGMVNNFKWVITEPKPESTWEIAQSAWAGDNAFIYFPDLQFFDNEGRLTPTAVYPNLPNADYSALGSEYTISKYKPYIDTRIDPPSPWIDFTGIDKAKARDGDIVTNAEIDFNFGTKWINVPIIDSLGFHAGYEMKPFCKVSLRAVPLYDERTTFSNGFNQLVNIIFGTNLTIGYHNLFGFENFDFELSPAFAVPSFIGIPQESKRFLWGPWYSFNAAAGQKGKVSVENDASFTPEAFGSIAAMNAAAQTIINADLDIAFESETGYIELAELPQMSLADRFYSGGPYVTQMSISVDASNGFKTTYNFQNWTKKSAALSRYNIETLKKARSIQFSYYKNIRELFKNPPIRRNNKSLMKAIARIQREQTDKASNMIAGVFMNGIARSINRKDPELGNRRKKAGASVHNVTTSMGMRSIAATPNEGFAISQEQFYTPLFSYDQNNWTGVYHNYNLATTGEKAFYNYSGFLDPRDVYPSVEIYDSGNVAASGKFFSNAVSPTSHDLDPYFYFPSSDFIHTSKDRRDNTSGLHIRKDPIKHYVKSMGIRGPMLMSGWGYDTKGLPVPTGSVVDSSGVPVPSGGPDPYRFNEEASTDRSLWKTGPVDLRWHNKRNVWVGGAEMLEGYLLEDMGGGYSTATMSILRLPSGEQITGTGEYLTLTNRDPSLLASSGAYIIAVDINEEWRPIYIGCPI